MIIVGGIMRKGMATIIEIMIEGNSETDLEIIKQKKEDLTIIRNVIKVMITIIMMERKLGIIDSLDKRVGTSMEIITEMIVEISKDLLEIEDMRIEMVRGTFKEIILIEMMIVATIIEMIVEEAEAGGEEVEEETKMEIEEVSEIMILSNKGSEMMRTKKDLETEMMVKISRIMNSSLRERAIETIILANRMMVMEEKISITD